MMGFFKDVILKPAPGILGVASGLFGIIGWLVLPDTVSFWMRLTLVSLVFLLAGTVFLWVVASGFYEKELKPLGVKNIRRGEYYYTGSLIVILEKGDWPIAGNLATLTINNDGFSLPLALIRIDTINDAGVAQCVVLKVLGQQDLELYLIDSSRWKSMFAHPSVKYEHLEV